MKHQMVTRPWALVTGASGGIGLEIARGLAEREHDLVLVARNAARLQELAAEIAKVQGCRVEVIDQDLAVTGAADTITRRLAERDITIEVLVNNAGFGLFGKHIDTALADEQRMIDVNIVALTRLTKLLLPAMVARRRGTILNLASTAAFQPGPNMAVYFATKAYVLSYSEALAEELRGTGVRVTALCPGPTESGFQDQALMRDSGLVKGRRLPGTRKVADYALRAVEHGKTVAVHGLMNHLMVQSLRLLPRALVRRVVALVSRPV